MATLTITSNGLPNPASFGKPFGQNAFSPSTNVVSAQNYISMFRYISPCLSPSLVIYRPVHEILVKTARGLAVMCAWSKEHF